MSYDIEVGVKVSDTDLFARVATPEHDHPTYNLGDMFRACTGWDFEQGEWYRCSEVIDLINNGINELFINTKKYRRYEAKNGWGTIYSAVQALQSMRDCIYQQALYIPIEHLYVRW